MKTFHAAIMSAALLSTMTAALAEGANPETDIITASDEVMDQQPNFGTPWFFRAAA